MLRWLLILLCTVCMIYLDAPAQSVRGVVVVLAGDAPTLETLSRELIAARDKLGLSENQVTVSRMLTQRWKPAQYKALGIRPGDLPLLSMARVNAQGKVVALVGYPDFVERNVADPTAGSERLMKRWAEAAGLATQPPQPLIRAISMLPEPKGPFPIGAEILITVQAMPGGSVQINSASNRTVSLPELGGGLYQGKYEVSADEKGDIALNAHFVGPRGETADQPVGVFQAVGWVAPRFLSVNPLGGDVYQVKGTAPPLSVVKARCHIDMGRFLFVGYPDFDGEWTVQTDRNGEFSFNMDLNQAETRRSGELEAQFSAYAENPDNPEQRTEETQFTGKVRMNNYTRYYTNSSLYFGTGYYGWGRPGWGWGYGYPYRRGWGRCW